MATVRISSRTPQFRCRRKRRVWNINFNGWLLPSCTVRSDLERLSCSYRTLQARYRGFHAAKLTSPCIIHRCTPYTSKQKTLSNAQKFRNVSWTELFLTHDLFFAGRKKESEMLKMRFENNICIFVSKLCLYENYVLLLLCFIIILCFIIMLLCFI